MKTAIVKFPFKLQDLVIIEITRIYIDKNISVIPVNYVGAESDYTGADILLGLGKAKSKADGFLISQSRVFNHRDVEYIDHLRFNGKIPGKECVRLKSVLNILRSKSINNSDKQEGSGVYAKSDIYSIMESYNGYENNIKEEYLKKSHILGSWLKEVISKDSHPSVTISEVSEELRSNLNERFNLDMYSLDDFQFVKPKEVLSNRLKNVLKPEIEEFSKFENASGYSSSLYKFINKDNLKFWIDLWITSRIEDSDRDAKYIDLWNKCDFSRSGVAINTSGILIPNWKELARAEGDIVFFVTPEAGTDNWSIISLNPNKYPMVESDIPYWIHVSKFLSKVDSKEKADSYLEKLDETYKIMYLVQE
jgi:hypothetical protein